MRIRGRTSARLRSPSRTSVGKACAVDVGDVPTNQEIDLESPSTTPRLSPPSCRAPVLQGVVACARTPELPWVS